MTLLKASLLSVLTLCLIFDPNQYAIGFHSSKITSKKIRPSSPLQPTKISDDISKIQLAKSSTTASSSLASTLSNDASSSSPPSILQTKLSQLQTFTSRHFFLLGMATAVLLARLLPSLGTDGGILHPERFIGKYGVMTIFLLSGLSLEVSELKDAAAHHRLNIATQITSFFLWPAVVGLPLVTILGMLDVMSQPLRDGLLILTTLPTTVNMCVFLTSAAGGNVASSLCNAVLGNLLGIFVTPLLLMRFFGKSIELPFGAMIMKLCGKVLLPVGVGQVLRQTGAKAFYEGNKKGAKRLQEMILLGIVWNAFCNAFTKGIGLDLRNATMLFALIPTLHIASLLALFVLFQLPFFRFTRGQTVAATFCASHKTLAFGLPLVNTIFEGHPNLAAYCAPIMFVHPMQLLIGSLIVPKFKEYIEEGGEGSKDD